MLVLSHSLERVSDNRRHNKDISRNLIRSRFCGQVKADENLARYHDGSLLFPENKRASLEDYTYLQKKSFAMILDTAFTSDREESVR